MLSPAALSQCSDCGNFGDGLKRCSGCKMVFYCSKSCQRADWPKHKTACKLKRTEEVSGSPRESAEPTTDRSNSKQSGNYNWFVRDYLTGSMSSAVNPPFSVAEILPSPAPSPDPTELSRLARKLEASLPNPRFFDPPSGGEPFSFITDLRSVPPDLLQGAIGVTNLQKLVAIAKIVKMDVYSARHGIRIMDERSKHPLLVLFYVKDDKPFPYFKWSDLVPGNYICIQAPVFHSFLDGQIGFRIDFSWQVRVLTTSGQLTFE